ncbi:MYND-type zinc finger protein samB [[Emmonsia] crescens]|uniref:MYND-type zinc finger protein samB n=1 Tax=[Emmonsia] crescens TaxID=73230 RepID=A0A0G2HSD4_9EURO|nr:MYND-type zinc finger protein samB [Emmonsia crescens UAMH 3008]
MREVNFSIPNVNKAAVNITTTLYDRRALDCTSTLPLINSLNHLAYLTTSSARIRDILTVDGGIEQLVCILKEGRSKDLMEMWKWNLAFQCVVNIGVRGTENVRTRVVEADIVPVVATILDNYIRVVDKIRARADAEAQRNTSRVSKPSSRSRDQSNRSSFFDRAPTTSDHRTTRRQAPPPSIEIPHPYSRDAQHGESGAMEIIPSPQVILTSPPERTTFSRDARSHRTHEGRHQPGTHRHRIMQPLATAVPPVDGTDGFGLRPVRDVDRLPSMVPGLQPGLNSQPESPTTPHAVGEHQNSAPLNARARRRPSIRQQPSGSGESDDANGDDVVMGEDPSPHHVAEPIVDVQNGMEIDNVGESGSMLDGSSETHGITIPNPSDTPEAETFNITHPSAIDVSIINTTTQPGNGAPGLSPVRPTALNTASPVTQQTPYPFYLRDRQVAPGVLTAMPRDEDVLMALQLLAYVSKYCNLRSYFQKTHLVPKLKLGKDIHLLDDASAQPQSPLEPEEEEEEYLLPDDFNIFPLVEKFTIRHHTKDMQYWACVVMRNLCRKDDARGGIRQCAYYKCGKWEEFQRQFAKCRRCRRTKYCSKECQKNAWAFHRHWCHITPGPTEQPQGQSEQAPVPSEQVQ